MPPILGGKSLVTSRDGTSSRLYVAGTRYRARVRASRRRRAPRTGARRARGVDAAPEQGSPTTARSDPARNPPRSLVTRRRATEDQRAESLRQVEERADRADDRRALGVVDAGERERQHRRVHQRHPAGEEDRAEDQAGDRRPRRHHRQPGRAPDERERPGAAGAEPVRQLRARDPHHEDEAAVQQEHEARVVEPDVLDVERDELGEAGEPAEPEEEHDARARATTGSAAAGGSSRASVRRACRGGERLARREREHAGGQGQQGRDDPDRVVVRGVEHHLADRRAEREPAVDRHRPVRDRLAASSPRARGRRSSCRHRRRTRPRRGRRARGPTTQEARGSPRADTARPTSRRRTRRR